jgi:hypothetical protein
MAQNPAIVAVLLLWVQTPYVCGGTVLPGIAWLGILWLGSLWPGTRQTPPIAAHLGISLQAFPIGWVFPKDCPGISLCLWAWVSQRIAPRISAQAFQGGDDDLVLAIEACP